MKFASLITPEFVRKWLNWLGATILVVGLTASALIWRAQDRIEKSNPGDQPVNASDPLAASDSRRDTRDIEIYYGNTGVLYEHWSEWVATLFHGKPLAKTIAVVSVISAAGCFLVSARLNFLMKSVKD